MDKKTTSVFQSFDLNAAFGGLSSQLIVRPPANMKVFRCQIYVSPVGGNGGEAYISNQQMFSTQDGILLSCYETFEVTTSIAPGTDTGFTNKQKTEILFDRRGVGYMQDNFYCFGTCIINFVWEGEIS